MNHWFDTSTFTASSLASGDYGLSFSSNNSKYYYAAIENDYTSKAQIRTQKHYNLTFSSEDIHVMV